MRRNSRNPSLAVPRLPRRYCCRERSYICAGPGPAGFPDGPTGARAALVSSGGTGCWARSSIRARSSVRRCWLWPVSSCTVTSCCCTPTRSVRTSPRNWTRYACCTATACCTAASSFSTESICAAGSASAGAASAFRAATWSSTSRTSPWRAQPAASPRLRTNATWRDNARRLRLPQRVTAGENFELVAAVLRPRRFVVALRDRPLLAVRHGLDAAGVDAVAHEVLLRRGGAPVAEREVVFVRPALVAVPGDPDPQVGIRLQDRDLLIERRGVARPDVRLVEVEVDHRGEHRAHGFRRVPHGGERIGRPLPGHPLGFLARPRIGLGPRDGILAGPLGRRDRIGIGLGTRLGRRRVAAARGQRGRGETREHPQWEASHLHPLSQGYGVEATVSRSPGGQAGTPAPLCCSSTR